MQNGQKTRDVINECSLRIFTNTRTFWFKCKHWVIVWEWPEFLTHLGDVAPIRKVIKVSLDNVVSSLFPTKVWKSIFGTPFVQKICCSSVGFRMPVSCCPLKWATLSIKLSKSANLSSLGNLSEAFYRNIIRISFSLKIHIFMQVQCKPSMTFWVGYIYRIYLIYPRCMYPKKL